MNMKKEMKDWLRNTYLYRRNCLSLEKPTAEITLKWVSSWLVTSKASKNKHSTTKKKILYEWYYRRYLQSCCIYCSLILDGNFIHNVFYFQTATLSIGDCDTEISIKHGDRIPGYRCAGRATQVLEERCAKIDEICHRFLDLTGPLQIGGVPTLSTDFQIQNKHFSGCIRNVYIDDEFLDLDGFVYNNGTVSGCPQKATFCKSDTCKNGGEKTQQDVHGAHLFYFHFLHYWEVL